MADSETAAVQCSCKCSIIENGAAINNIPLPGVWNEILLYCASYVTPESQGVCVKGLQGAVFQQLITFQKL